jgi:hypothetical protein
MTVTVSDGRSSPRHSRLAEYQRLWRNRPCPILWTGAKPRNDGEVSSEQLRTSEGVENMLSQNEDNAIAVSDMIDCNGSQDQMEWEDATSLPSEQSALPQEPATRNVITTVDATLPPTSLSGAPSGVRRSAIQHVPTSKPEEIGSLCRHPEFLPMPPFPKDMIFSSLPAETSEPSLHESPRRSESHSDQANTFSPSSEQGVPTNITSSSQELLPLSSDDANDGSSDANSCVAKIKRMYIHWTGEEDDLLHKLIRKHGDPSHENNGKTWSDVAALVPGKTRKQVAERWASTLNPLLNKGPWTDEEDSILCRLQGELGNKWSEIAKFLPGRSQSYIKNRFNNLQKKLQKEGPRRAYIKWTDDEDDSVRAAVRDYGDPSDEDNKTTWSDIAKTVPGKSLVQVRERWIYHLDPSLNKGPWSNEEDSILCRLQGELGNKWSEIAKRLPGRCYRDVMNRWCSTQQKKRTHEELAKVMGTNHPKVAGNKDDTAPPRGNEMGEDSSGFERPSKIRRTESFNVSGPDESITQDQVSAGASEQHPHEPNVAGSWLPLLSVADGNDEKFDANQNSNMSRANPKPRSWSVAEDESLLEAVTQMVDSENEIIWAAITRQFSDRTRGQVRERWTNHVDPSLKKGSPWSVEEDESLRKAVTQLVLDSGDGYNRRGIWVEIAKLIPGKNAKQARERWVNQLDPSLKKGPWSVEEQNTLCRLQFRLGNKWTEIAKCLPGRCERDVKNRWYTFQKSQNHNQGGFTNKAQVTDHLNVTLNEVVTQKNRLTRGNPKAGPWTVEEDKRLRTAVTQMVLGPGDEDEKSSWLKIAKQFPGKTWRQVRNRWTDRWDSSQNKGPWSEDEDEKLRKAVTQLDFVSDNRRTSWIEIAKQIPRRNGKQARERWLSALDPSIKKGPWSLEEFISLRSLQFRLGNKWTEIAKCLPGRCESDVKNRWYTFQKSLKCAQRKSGKKKTKIKPVRA